LSLRTLKCLVTVTVASLHWLPYTRKVILQRPSDRHLTVIVDGDPYAFVTL